MLISLRASIFLMRRAVNHVILLRARQEVPAVVLTRPVLCFHPPRAEQGALTFEKDATFLRCFNGKFDGSVFDDDASSGGGGAVYHHAKGAMHFMGKLTMIDNEADTEVSV